MCHYSAQKPMGRPRKARSSAQPPPSMPVTQDWQEPPQADVVVDSAMDIDLGLDVDPNLQLPLFLDFLGPDFISNQPLDPMYIGGPPAGTGKGLPEACPMMLDINFDPPPPPTPPSTASPSTPLDLTGTPKPVPNTLLCSCLANIYLALDSLNRLPDDLPKAIRIARSAAKTAHDALQCQSCCPPLPQSNEAAAAAAAPYAPTVSISAHQTTMLLGTLIPTIANAYHRILALVDAETARAAAAQTTMLFSLSDIGGFWLAATHGSSGAAVSSSCPLNAAAYENMTLDPSTWRLSVRAVLKVDVYGVQCSRQSADAAATMSLTQLGLRDLVARMDDISRTRHAELDALMEAGVLREEESGGFMRVRHTRSLEAEGRSHLCRNIIATAKEAVDSLVIP